MPPKKITVPGAAL
jgi:hypothetical protein